MRKDLDKLFFHIATSECEGDCYDCYLQQRYKEHPKNVEDCDEDECFFCSIIACPFDNELHFHHDGCPDCSQIKNTLC